jgi:23S rRNA pseudouridine1911/1915/1917 synthase
MGRPHYIDEPQIAGPQAAADPGEEVDGIDDPPVPVATFVVGPEHGGWRLDRVLAALLPSVSRSRLQAWIERGAAQVNGRAARTRERVYEGDRLRIERLASPELSAYVPEPMALDIVHEDAWLIVVDKPPGLVVHPGAGNWSGTLLNGLLAHDPALAGVPRAGIVHRLDAGTSGLMVVAKTLAVQLELVRQMQARQVTREYWAIVAGAAPAAGTIDAPLGRDPRNPLRFRVTTRADARPARTHFRRIALSGAAASGAGATVSWLACRLDTGRTHQIRVHLESIGHPLLGDPLYCRRRPALSGPARSLSRQALHACRLSLRHPGEGREVGWFRSPPPDLRELMRGFGFAGDGPVDAFEVAARR